MRSAVQSFVEHDVETSTQPAIWSRLSESALWKLQREFFESAGAGAWSAGLVPSYITSNPYIANVYARCIFECAVEFESLYGTAPYILELGGGSGRFAFHFLRAWSELERDRGVAPRLNYVFSDAAESNVQAVLQRSEFAGLVAAGQMDFARFDPTTDRELRLIESGRTITPESPAPILAIANYVWDGLPADAFEVRDGATRELECSLTFANPVAHAPPPASPLDRIRLEYRSGEEGRQPYDAGLWNGIFVRLSDEIGSGAFSFPVGALHALETLRALSGDRLAVFASDKGRHLSRDLAGMTPPQPARHGSVSFGVNFRALALYGAERGAVILQSEHSQPHLTTLGLVFAGGGDSSAERSLKRAFADSFGANSPNDFFALKKSFELALPELDPAQLLAWLRVSRDDPRLLAQSYERLLETLPARADLWADAARAFERVQANYFWLGPEEDDLAFQIGNLFAAIGEYAMAREAFRQSMARYGEDEGTLENLRLCERFLEGR